MRGLKIGEDIINELKDDYMNKLLTHCLLNKYIDNISIHLNNLIEFAKTYQIKDCSEIKKCASYYNNTIVILENSDKNLNEYFNNCNSTHNNIIYILEKIYLTLSEKKGIRGKLEINITIDQLISLTCSKNPKLLTKYYMKVIFPSYYQMFIIAKIFSLQINISFILDDMISSLYFISSLEISPNKILISAVHLKYIVKFLLLSIKGFENKNKHDCAVLSMNCLLNKFYNIYIFNSKPFEEVEKQFPKCKFLRFILRKRYLLNADLKNLKINTPDHIKQYIKNQKNGKQIVNKAKKIKLFGDTLNSEKSSLI